jgi:hypothetical protein
MRGLGWRMALEAGTKKDEDGKDVRMPEGGTDEEREGRPSAHEAAWR